MTTVINNSFLGFIPVGTHIVTGVLSTATELVVPEGATGAIVQAVDDDVSYTFDGVTTPTTTVGFIQSPADTPTRIDLFPGCKVQAFSNTGILQIQFFKIIDHSSNN